MQMRDDCSVPRNCYVCHKCVITQGVCYKRLAVGTVKLTWAKHISSPAPWSATVFLFNTLRPRQDGRHFLDDIFTCIFLNENEWHSIKISLEFVPKIPINNIPALVQIMAWSRPGDKPLSEPMMVVLPTHICVTRPQWINALASQRCGCDSCDSKNIERHTVHTIFHDLTLNNGY